MAITVSVVAGSEQDYHDRFGIGYPVTLEYEADFNTNVTGRWVNFNLYLWGEELTIEAPLPPPIGPLPEIGYNVKYFSGGYTTLQLAGIQPFKKTWANVEVAARFPTTNTMRIRLRFVHTADMDRWIHQIAAMPNERRLLHSRMDNPVPFDLSVNSFYNQWFADRFIGIGVYLLKDAAIPGFYTIEDYVQEAINRRWAWFWNPHNPDLSTYPYSHIKAYYWQFFRNSIPVSNLSTTEDTDVIVTLETLDTAVLNTQYWVGVIRVQPTPMNMNEYWLELPYSLGKVTAMNTFGQAVSWLPADFNGDDIVTDCDLLDNVSADLWEARFTVPKEIVATNERYRVVLLIRHEFDGLPP